MKGTINLVKNAVHQHFNDQQGCKRICDPTSSPVACEFSSGRFDVWPCILVIINLVIRLIRTRSIVESPNWAMV